GDLGAAEAGLQQANAELPVLHAVTHRLVVAAGSLPCRSPDQHAIRQAIKKQLVEPVEMARHHAVHITGETHVSEGEAHFARRLAQHRDGFGEERGVETIVAIERQHELPARLAEAGVARAGETPVLLRHKADARFKRGELLQRRFLGRTVIDDDGLEIAEGLGRKALAQVIEKASAVVARHDDADGRFAHAGIRIGRGFRHATALRVTRAPGPQTRSAGGSNGPANAPNPIGPLSRQTPPVKETRAQPVPTLAGETNTRTSRPSNSSRIATRQSSAMRSTTPLASAKIPSTRRTALPGPTPAGSPSATSPSPPSRARISSITSCGTGSGSSPASTSRPTPKVEWTARQPTRARTS